MVVFTGSASSRESRRRLSCESANLGEPSRSSEVCGQLNEGKIIAEPHACGIEAELRKYYARVER